MTVLNCSCSWALDAAEKVDRSGPLRDQDLPIVTLKMIICGESPFAENEIISIDSYVVLVSLQSDQLTFNMDQRLLEIVFKTIRLGVAVVLNKSITAATKIPEIDNGSADSTRIITTSIVGFGSQIVRLLES